MTKTRKMNMNKRTLFSFTHAAMRRHRAVSVAVCLFACTAAAAGVQHRFTATVNYSGSSATDIPAALRVSQELVPGFDYAAAGDGTHFVITDATGAVLPYEIDTWNPGGESLLWVKVPFFQNGRRLTVTYGETAADMTSRAADVWSNYIGVWHMNAVNGSGRYPNSTGDARFDGEVSSFSKTGVAGRFGQSVLIYTNAAHLASGVEKGGVFIPDNGNLDLSGSFALSAWLNHSSVAGNGNQNFRWDNIFCKRQHPQTAHAANNGSTAGFGVRVGAHTNEVSKVELYGPGNNWNPSLSPALTNEVWRHVGVVFSNETACLWLDGTRKSSGAPGTLTDNDEPLALGNAGKGYLDNEGDRAWGGSMDEVRLIRGAPSDAYLAAEYAAMTGALVVNSDICVLTIDRNEFFGDSVTVTSDVSPAPGGGYYAGTTITLTAVPDATGSFRKWYGDVPRESRTNATASFVIERDSWVYARFVHPWTLSADRTTMTDGNFVVNVSEVNESKHTLTVGRIVSGGAGLLADGDTGSGVVDLGGPIRLDGDETPWTITKFAAAKSTQVVSTNHVGEVHTYISPGTVTIGNGSQILHCGDSNPDKGQYPFAFSYKTIILDEPDIPSMFNTYLIANQAEVTRLIYDLPKVGDAQSSCYRAFYKIPLTATSFDWWDISSLGAVTNSFFANTWGRYYEMYRRVPCRGTLSLPRLRGVGWIPNDGTLLYLMPGVEEISLGGATEETTVTNLCTYAFAGDSSLRKLTLHADKDMTVGRRIFADHTYNESNGREPEIIDGVTYLVGSNTSKGRVPEVIHFTGEAISSEAIENLLDACPVVATCAKPVTIYASRYQRGWAGEDKVDWLSAPTAAERAFFPDERVLGVYRAGEEAPYGKAVIIHRENPWDDVRDPGLFIILR